MKTVVLKRAVMHHLCLLHHCGLNVKVFNTIKTEGKHYLLALTLLLLG